METALQFKADILYWVDEYSQRLCASCVKQVPETVPDMIPKISSHPISNLSRYHPIACGRCYLSLVKVTATLKEKERITLDVFLKLKEFVEDANQYFEEEASPHLDVDII